MSEQPLIHEDALRDLPPQDVDRVLDKADWLWKHRTEVVHLPLEGNLTGFYKRRIGKYRLIYTYDKNPDELVIRLVGTRESIYKEATARLAKQESS